MSDVESKPTPTEAARAQAFLDELDHCIQAIWVLRETWQARAAEVHRELIRTESLCCSLMVQRLTMTAHILHASNPEGPLAEVSAELAEQNCEYVGPDPAASAASSPDTAD